ncbi:MAG: hypothetical protein N2507_03245 [Candidatus Bipolaricaulota bacterium]|nr:hypothetical protein [Candidatus Bipolaricaulota bacterium]
MRPVSAEELALYHSFLRTERFRVCVRRRDGTEVDITDRVLSISISHSGDEPISTASLEIDDGWTRFGASQSLNPLILASTYNQPGPLLWPNNEVRIYVGLAPLGQDVQRWSLLFHGVIGDSIGLSGSKRERTISLHLRDLGKRLQERLILGEFLYGSESGEAVVAVMQGLLDQHVPDLGIRLLVRDNPQFMIFPVKVGECSVWEALQNLLKPTGFQCRYWFWPAGSTAYDCAGNPVPITTDGFYLTVVDPKRTNTTPVDSLSADVDTLTEEDIELCDDTIRNSVWVRYYDRHTGQYMECHRADGASIATYGERIVVIGQDDVPYIDTYPEAWELAGVVLHDLSEVPATDRLTCQFMPHLEPWDLLDVTNARLSSGTCRLGITEIRHELPAGGPFTTTLTGTRDRVIGQLRAWLTSRGGATPRTPAPAVLRGQANTHVHVTETGELSTEVVLEVVPPNTAEIEHYEWRYALAGEGIWHESVTAEPKLILRGLPPRSRVVWTARAKLKGGER